MAKPVINSSLLSQTKDCFHSLEPIIFENDICNTWRSIKDKTFSFEDDKMKKKLQVVGEIAKIEGRLIDSEITGIRSRAEQSAFTCTEIHW